MAKTREKQKGPSFSALAALATLAIALWLEVDLATAIFRSVIIYLVLSLVSMAYKIILGRYLAVSQAKVEQELLEKIQREAEEEERKKQEKKRQAEENQAKAQAEVEKNGQPEKAMSEEPKPERSEKTETKPE